MAKIQVKLDIRFWLNWNRSPRANYRAQFNMVTLIKYILENALGTVPEWLLLWDQPLTPRDRSHALGPSPGEYRTFVIEISYTHDRFCLNRIWILLYPRDIHVFQMLIKLLKSDAFTDEFDVKCISEDLKLLLSFTGSVAIGRIMFFSTI